jgi:hypothetical protein
MPEQSESSDFEITLGKDGILRLRLAHGTVIDLDFAKRIVARASELSAGVPRPMLVHGDETKNMEREARRYFANTPGPAAQAIVVNSPIGRMIASAYTGLSKQNLPTRTFVSEEEAVEWLKTFLPGSSPAASQDNTTAEA